MSLNRHEKHLIKVLEGNPRINTREFIKLADIGKTTFYKYTKTLEQEGYISYEKIKNQNVWYLMKKKKNEDWGMINFEDSKKIMETRFEELESKISQAIKKAKKGSVNDKVTGYGDSVLLLLSTLGLFKLIYYYRKKQIPDIDVQFEKKVERLLENITNEKFNPEYGYGRLSIDHVIRTTESRLNEFLGIPEPKITEI